MTRGGAPFAGDRDGEWADVLQRSLPIAIPPEKVALVGAWSREVRRQYQSPSQQGSGCGPYVEVVDARWRGTIECEVPVAGVAFLQTADAVYWVKSAPAVVAQPIQIHVSGYVDDAPHAAMLSCGLGGGWLPAVPLQAKGDLIDCCRMGSGETTTGVPYLVCESEAARFITVLVQQPLAKTGRNRLWQLRPRAAQLLPVGIRELFTRGRCGSWQRSGFDSD